MITHTIELVWLTGALGTLLVALGIQSFSSGDIPLLAALAFGLGLGILWPILLSVIALIAAGAVAVCLVMLPVWLVQAARGRFGT